MTVRTSRFGFGFDPASVEQQSRRRSDVQTFRPIAGFDNGQRFTDLEPGFTPQSRNFVVEDRALKPRSGLSSFHGASGLSAAVRGGTEAFDEEGNFYALAASDTTFAVLPSSDPEWKVMTDNGTTPSGSTNDFWDSAVVWDDDRSNNIAVLTNGVDLPKFAELETTVNSVSDLTQAASVLSNAKTVAVMDDRLVFGNVEDSSLQRVNRVAWSARGKVQNWSNLGTEAGFEDLGDMAGEINHLIEEEQSLLVLGSQEIWRGEPRRDSFAFDFFPVERKLGCPFPQTAQKTPFGVVFLSQDLEVYLIRGSRLQTLGPREDGESRIQSKLKDEAREVERAFAVYNSEQRRYELYYVVSGADFPTRALFYDFGTDSWTEQRWPVELTFGYDFVDPGAETSTPAWGDQPDGQSWGDTSGTWGDFGIATKPTEAERDVTLFSSDGTAYRARTGQTTDDGTPIDSRWRSHGVRVDESARKNTLDAVEIEYELTGSASSLTVAGSVDGFDSLAAEQVRSLETTRVGGKHVALTPVVGRAPQFELRTEAGDGLEISRLHAHVRQDGRFLGSD